MTIEATGISDDTHAPIAVLASADANGRGRISVRGTLIPSPFSLDSQTSLSAIDLMPFRAYAAPVSGLTLSAGTLGFDGRMLFSSLQPYLIEGNGTLTAVEFQDLHGKRLLGCRTATLHDLRFDGTTSRNRIRRADLDGMYADVAIDKQKNLNLSAIGKTAVPTASAADGTAPTSTAPAGTGQPGLAAASGAPQPAASSLEIALIDFRNATVDYRDDSLVLPFATLISPAGGTITDFSTTGKAASTMHFKGNVAEHGSMSASGTLRAVDPFAGTDLSVQFRGVPMPTLTPYAAEFAGYSIERGLLDLDLHYRIVDRKLTGDHRVVATNLTLGQKVAGSHAGFAVRLAVALLKDRQGRIQMEVPIEGTVDSPEFNYRAVLWQSVKTILGNVARSPFRALGAAMGTSSENLDIVSFEPGEAIVLPGEREKLAKMAAELTARPELNLGVEGRFDRDLDTVAIRRAKLEAAIASRRESVQMASASASLDSILEELYSQTFSSDRLAEERAKFTKQPATPPPPPAEAKKGWRWRRSERPPQSAAQPVPTEAAFDATGFYDDVRSQLVAAQSVSSDDLQALARGRSAAVLAVLTANGLDQTRVRALPPSEAKNKSRIPQVESALQLSAQSNGSAGGAED